MGPLRYLSLQLESGNDRTVADGCRNRYRGDFRRTDRHNGETFRRKTDSLHRPVFWIERNVCRRPGQNRSVAAGFDPNHFTLEYFHASRAKHDDSSRQRLSWCERDCALPDDCDYDLFLERDLESLCVRRIGNKDRLGTNRVPVSFQACQTRKAVDSSPVLQNAARGCLSRDKELDSRRCEILRRPWLL